MASTRPNEQGAGVTIGKSGGKSGGKFGGKFGSVVRIGMAGLALAILSACSAIYANHGYVPTDKDLEQVVVGQSTQQEVADAIGRPSSIGILTGSGWYYVGSRFKQVGLRAPVEIDRQVVAVSYDDEGVVSNVERFGLEKGQAVVISRRVTDSNIKGLSFLQQLLGNIGNLNAADFLNKN
jgi:outer membrane protein assembly factor BamE (lipoprotein component of BamABCDE complex)